MLNATISQLLDTATAMLTTPTANSINAAYAAYGEALGLRETTEDHEACRAMWMRLQTVERAFHDDRLGRPRRQPWE